jgi:hypothetical protein
VVSCSAGCNPKALFFNKSWQWTFLSAGSTLLRLREYLGDLCCDSEPKTRNLLKRRAMGGSNRP